MPEITPKKLADNVKVGYAQLEPHRKQLLAAIREFLGQHVGQGDGVRRAVNLVAQAASILLPNLVSEPPKHRVRTPLAELRGEATMLELALDRLWEDTGTLDEVRRATLDAILGPCGVIRLGMRAGKDFVTVDAGRRVPVAEPYCRRVAFDDYCCDPAARSQHEMRWEAIRYRISRRDAIESGVFGRDPGEYGPEEEPIEGVATRKEAAEILADVPSLESGTRREDAAGMGKPNAGPDLHGLVDTIELWDVFLYLGDAIWTVTVPATHDDKNPVAARHNEKWLLAERWEGPDPGPLIVFGFFDIPDQPLFKPVVADWMDLHQFCKIVSNKLATETENTKVVWACSPDAEDDAMSVRDAKDSGIVRVQNPGSITKLEIVGVVKEIVPLMDWAERQWANASGNLPLAGGQGSEATDKTATAAQYLQANSSQRIGEMRQRVEDVLAAIDRQFGWYLTTDPLVKLPLPYRIPGGETVTLHYDAATRRGDYQSYTFSIERYSAVGQDPNVRLKRVTEFLTMLQNFIPAMQMGLVSPQGMSNIGEQEYGLENLDELLPMQAQGLQMQAHMARQGLAPGMGVPGQSPGMTGDTRDETLGGVDESQTTPVGAARSAMAVGVGT